ncbi:MULTISPECIES: ABC transporter permease [unclassified Holdemanella]|uniref:ABC transporter permease n=1 Tax=unclassified Holdemanella TaxID=2633909 RepID=UPI001D0A3B99|nr:MULTISPECIES: ABC transporter permease [unclassified Holdemanella]MCB8641027.1 ABC transporter permease [Holdemanella sp. DFI.5.55]MCG5649516.1 ABC transporter permease [Holdemanella sp. DFI.5.21]
MSIFKNLYNYRELLKTNVKKDIRGRYKGSFLGILWSFLNPLLQVVVYWIVFPYLFGRGVTGENYLIYLITGIIPWTFFMTSVNMGTSSIKANGGIIKKVYFPREIIPLSQVLSGIVNFLISCLIIIIFCIGTGTGLSYHVIAVFPILIVQSLLTLGIVLILSAVDVYVQDIENIVAFILNMLMYGTPIIYHLSQFSASSAGVLYTLITINPLTTIIGSYRNAFMYHQWPDFKSLGLVFVFSLVVLGIGYMIFKKLEKGFAEEL